MLTWVLATALALTAVGCGLCLVALSGPPPLTPDQLEAWQERHPLVPPPHRPTLHARLRALLRTGLVLPCALGAGWGGWLAWAHPHRAYVGVSFTVAAVLWPCLCLELARLRGRGELRLPPRRSAESEGRRWEILDLYSERLIGEETTGLTSFREDLARRARRTFRRDEDLAFLRRVRTGSRSGAYRTAAARVLEDLGVFEGEGSTEGP